MSYKTWCVRGLYACPLYDANRLKAESEWSTETTRTDASRATQGTSGRDKVSYKAGFILRVNLN